VVEGRGDRTACLTELVKLQDISMEQQATTTQVGPSGQDYTAETTINLNMHDEKVHGRRDTTHTTGRTRMGIKAEDHISG